MLHPTRRTFLATAALAAGAGFSTAAFAAYPDKPIRLVVPYGGGGMGSVFGTLVTEVLTAQLKSAAYADYKPGANAVIGTDLVAKAPADGYTLLMATTSSIAINPAFLPNARYDPLKDFVPVAIVWTSRNVLFGSAEVKSVKDLVALGKKRPLQYGSLGVGTLAHLSSEMLLRATGIEAVHVPFKGQGQIMTEVAAGRLDFAFTDPTGLALAQGGKVNALAVTGKARLGVAASVPTLAEAGFPNVGTESWIAVLAPAGTPKDVVEKLSSALSAGFSTEAMKAKVAATGSEVAPNMTPAFFDRELRSELVRWKKFQQDTRITIEQ
jgi:tripartite-type tricarboxylate transporter receptor subunit TctC